MISDEEFEAWRQGYFHIRLPKRSVRTINKTKDGDNKE